MTQTGQTHVQHVRRKCAETDAVMRDGVDNGTQSGAQSAVQQRRILDLFEQSTSAAISAFGLAVGEYTKTPVHTGSGSHL